MSQPDTHMIPWDALRAQTLRAVLRDLGLRYICGRSEMVERLQEIERNGLDGALGTQLAVEREKGADGLDKELAPPVRITRATTAAVDAARGWTRRGARGRVSALRRAAGRESATSSAGAGSPVSCAGRDIFVGVVLPLVKDLKPWAGKANAKRKAESMMEGEEVPGQKPVKQQRSSRLDSALNTYVLGYGSDDE